MAAESASQGGPPARNAAYAVELTRGFGGAILFAFPLLMTMEMWSLGFSMDRLRLLLFILFNFVILFGLAWFVGFQKARSLPHAAMEALAAFALGVLAAATALLLFGIIEPAMSWGEIVGMIALQSVPASMGAAIARKQLGAGGQEEDEATKERHAGYAAELFLMAAGGVYLAFNVAPTEEMLLIAFKMSPWHAIALVLVSLLVLHSFVYSVGFAGQETAGDAGFWRLFISYSIVGYAIAIAISVSVLWIFGRTDGSSAWQIAQMTVVLGFPAALGAAAARLVV